MTSRSKGFPPCVCRKCGLNHNAPANPAWERSAPVSGRIRVDVLDRAGKVIGQKVVAVTEVDFYAVRDLLPPPDPRA